MKVNVYCFDWTIGDGITLDDFFSYLQSRSGIEESRRMIAICKKDGFWVGVFLTIKDMRAFCKIKRESGRFVITPQQLDEGSSMTDFNFFIVHPQTGRGLYQHYHQSASTNKFCSICRKHYSSLKEMKIESDLKDIKEPTALDRRRINNKYFGSLTYTILVKPESFEECIRTLRRIKSFKFEFSSLTAAEKAMTPVSGYASRMTHIINFNKNDDQNSIGNAIFDMIRNKTNALKKGVAKGIDPEGNEATIKLFNDYATFDQFEFNEIIQTIKIDSNDLVKTVQESDIVKELLILANKPNIKQILSVPIK